MNVLLSCVGRRGYLVDYFREALAGQGRVIAANSDPLTDGMWRADRAYEVPAVNDAGYIDALLDIAEKENVELVVSLFDIDLPFLSAARDRFAARGIRVAVPDEAVVDIANDKWRTQIFLQEHGFDGPRTWASPASALEAVNAGEVRWPLFVKPRWGMGSIGVQVARDTDELRFFHEHTRRAIARSYLTLMEDRVIEKDGRGDVLIQEGIAGQEYGLDIFNDFERRHVITTVKRKVRMRSGETDVAEVVDMPALTQLGERLGRQLGHVGNLDVDVMVSGDRLAVIEFNARFGGGYPFSHLAGANYPEMLVHLAQGRPLAPAVARVGTFGLKALVPMQAPEPAKNT
ncbi:ATP-grasp domain-containing protein [Kushneria indalinina]|uniref:Carbamoyl-phosphate synthase large subunit n=1 Tax=Kushneria indalinina DSM 14324 TaxID=1122140 RepID=A0A3D9DY53_9GAMM|nr:ATP-grasp domain-containing protein [Kushneria indalinina]REC95693.1 carbamoyl-phosphate synthase large subunit [Kushneria indalinina DSM 14324]